ncbi:MAG: DUF998 domain-containing protein [Jatrophihabitantaceae bacterium]
MAAATRVPGWALLSAAASPVLLIGGWLLADAVQPVGYSPMRQTVSVLAGHGGAHRWIMTSALVVVGLLHLVTATGLRCLRPAARIVLVVAGLAALGVAAFPEPAHGSTVRHVACTAVGAVAIAAWPAFVGRLQWAGSAVLGVRASVLVTAVFAVLLLWLVAETRHGDALGLAERLSSSVQICWPFAVALAARRRVRALARGGVPSRDQLSRGAVPSRDQLSRSRQLREARPVPLR